jgi:hypothetical protein
MTGDGCTDWINGVWRSCCDAHDLAYAAGLPKIPADLDLASCVAGTGHGVMALVMLAGVTIFGWLFYSRHS